MKKELLEIEEKINNCKKLLDEKMSNDDFPSEAYSTFYLIIQILGDLHKSVTTIQNMR